MKSLYYKSPTIIFILILIQSIFVVEVNAQCTTPTTPVVIVNPSTAICGQQNVNFTIDPASIQAGATYRWDFGDPSSNSNTASGTSATHAFTPNSSGATFNVTATAHVPTIPIAATWTNLVNSVVSNDSLIKSISSSNYNSSANSTQTIDEGEFIGFVADPNVQLAFGLSDLSSGNQVSAGTVNYERFMGINGTSISNLTNSADFPDNPSFSGTLTSLDAPDNIGSNFGSKIYGFIEAPQTGTYYFTITGDDASHFYLSSNESPSNLYLIAYLNGWSNVTQFNKYSTQRSIGLSLVAGERYYFEILHKEGTGGDHVQVYWETPSSATPTIIPGINLSPYVGVGSIDYAIETQNGVITIYESGVNQGSFGTVSLGDTLAVGILNGQVVYYQNGSIIHTSSNAPSSLPLNGDVSISTGSAALAGAFIGGQTCTSSGTASVTSSPTPGFTIGSSGFDRTQTCQTIINPGDQLGVVFGFSSGYNGTHTYTIDYGDGGGAVPFVGNVTAYTYTSPGVYIVTVTGDNGAGCVGTFQDTIFYLDRPLADMSIVGTADVCEGDTVFTLNNTDTISNRVVYYIWEWGDGSRDTIFYKDSAAHVFDLGDNLSCTDVPQGGMPYDVTLYAVNECFEHTNSSPITVSQTPTGDLSSVAIECHSVASTTGIPFSLNYCTFGISGTPSWNFGDTASGALDSLAFPPENPTHIFVGGPGFYEITVNVSTLCGEFNDTSRVHILREPTANASFSTNGSAPIANGDGCNPIEIYFNNASTGDSLVYDWTVTPSGGTSFINGTSNSSSNAQILFNTAGEFIVNMTATNPCGVSTWADTIIVVDGPAITLTPPTPTCDAFSYSPTVTYFDGGGAIHTYAWEFFEIDGSPTNNLLATSNQAFPTYNFTSAGDYMAIISITNDCTTKSDTVTFTIEATPGPITVNGGVPVETCVDNAPITLIPNLQGGTWSGTGIDANGVFDPSSVVPGTYTVYYNYDIGNGCPADVPFDVTVHPLPMVNAGANINVCINEPSFDISTGTPLGGTWTGTGITNQSNGTFDPVIAGVGLHTITYTYTDGNNCENTDELVVNVSGLPTVNAQADETYCDVNYDIQLNVATPVGGTWSGSGALYNNQGFFNIDSAGGLGTYTLYYTYVDANNCENLDSTEITVVNNLVVSAGNPDTLCINSGTHTLNNFSPSGGIWTGNGIIGQGPDFSPSAAGVGTHSLVYSYGTGTCSDTDVIDFVVEGITNVDAGNDTLVCAETDAFTLSPSPMGGIWSGPGITDGSAGIFNPNTAGVGTFFLTYTYTNPITDCISSDVIEVTVAPLPTVDAGATYTMCDTAVSFPITGYTPLGGLWSGPGITDPANAMFNPNLAGGLGYRGLDTIYTLYYTYVNNNGCENTDSLLMTVTFGDTLILSKGRDTVCINSGIYTITNYSPIGGTWSGPGIIGTSPNFSPQAAGVGLHTISYTSGTGSCLKKIFMQIQVDPIPTVDAGNNVLVCANDPVYTLSGHSPLGGIWTGTGIIDGNAGTFDPTIATGTYSLTYVYTDPVTGCENSDTRSITISPLPVVTVAGNVTECYVPTDIALTNYNPAGGVWSGPGIVDANNGTFNGDIAGGIGIYDLVYTYTDGNGCMNTDTTEMELIGVIVAEAGPGDTVCIYDSPITLTGFSPAGGTWTGTGIINGTTGQFDPGQVNPGIYTLTYTVGSGTCEDTDQTTVLVRGVPNVNAQNDEVVCVSAVPFNVTTATVVNGTGYGYWAGTGITDSTIGTFDPALATDGTHVLTYTFVDAIGGCEGSDNKNVIVHPLPNVNAGDTVAYCNTPSNIQLTGFTPTNGGIWSGQGIVDANNGVFNPITAGDVGTYPVVLTYTDGNNCTNDDTLYINVVAGDTVNAGPNDTLCIDDVAINLSGYPTGGIWSGTGITNASGVFDPSQVSAGFHYPVYTVGTGTCERIDTIEIFVSALPFVDAGTNIEMCIDAGMTTLTGQTPAGGYWTGNGIIDSIAGTFDPLTAGIGLHTVSYFVTNAFGCDNVDTRTIRVHDLPIVNAGDTVAYCFNSDNIQLSGFTPTSGGVWTGTGIIDANNGVFNANMAGATGIGIYNDIVLTYTDGNNCINSDSLTIIIEFGDTINAGIDLAMCIDNGLDTLMGYTPAFGGTWTGTGIVSPSGVFDPATAGGGIHQLVYTFGSGTCLKRDTIEVLVGTIPTVDAGTNQAVCIDEPEFNMTGFSPSDGFWTGQGVTDATLGTFNAASAGAGTHTLTYTYTNPITGCENFDTKQIIVHDLPIVNAGDTVEYCNNPDNITLTGYSPLGGNWSGAGIIDNINGIFNTINAGGEGTYYPVYTYTDGNGCTNFDTLVINVIYGDTVDAGDPIGMCITDGLYTINNGYTPSNGGTWSGSGIIDASLGIFDPSSVTINALHTIYYTYGIGTCQKIDSTTIFVGAVPVVEAGLNDTICELDNPLQLNNFTPSTGGIWTGLGIIDSINGIFDPGVAGVGTHTLTYYFENTFTGCSDSDTKLVTVNPPPTVNAGNNRRICETGNDFTLSGYSPLGGVWSGPGIVDAFNGVFNDFVAGGIGNYYVYYTYTDPNGCSNFDSIRIKVVFGDTVVAGPDMNVCIDGGNVTLTGGSPIGGTWSGTGIIDP
ncbi:MAG: PKD domain-containing protein, partial [Saprospiraceae bacterium]